MMLTNIEKKYLKETLFKELQLYSSIGDKPTLFCLIKLDNLLDMMSRKELEEQTMSSVNTMDSLEHYAKWKKTFYAYVNLLDANENIYPSIESFFDSLYINGEYKFLNFNNASIQRKSFKKDKNQEEVEISDFTYYTKELLTGELSYNQSKKIYRMKKKNVMRFYSREVVDPNSFRTRSAFLTLAINDKVKEMFNNVFQAKNFKLDSMTFEEDLIEIKIHKLIKEMIKAGEEYTEKNPILRHKEIFNYEKFKVGLNDGDASMVYLTEVVKEVEDDNVFYYEYLITDNFCSGIINIHYQVGDNIVYNTINYKIKEIRFLKNRSLNIVVEECK